MVHIRRVKIVESLQFHHMLFLDVINPSQIKFSFIKSFLTFGVDNALDDGLDGNQIVMNEDKVILVDFFDVLSDETPLLIEHLTVCNDFCLIGRAFLVLFLQFGKILVGEDLVIEGDRVLIGFVAVDDEVEFLAMSTVDSENAVVFLLLHNVVLKLSDDCFTLCFQLIVLF
jgi:hypothetical protein